MTIRNKLSRRAILSGIGAGGTVLAAPWVWPSRAHAAANELFVRTPGGVFDDVRQPIVYEPFRKLTGVTIVPVPATAARLLAMHRSGQMEVDVIDTGDDVLLQLDAEGALEPIDYSSFTHTNPDDIEETVRHASFTGSFNYAMVMAYNTEKFTAETAPQNWADFWDVERFAVPRTMPDMSSGAPDLEFALLADGVAMEDLYPLDIDRAFASLSRVKGAVTKFWDSGALSAQMLADREVYLASLWSTRASVAIDSGAPAALQWNQNAVLGQALGIAKGSPMKEVALQFIDFNASPEIQKEWFANYKAVPVNRRAYDATAPELLDPESGTPLTISRGFVRDIKWWAENRGEVNDRWSIWIAE